MDVMHPYERQYLLRTITPIFSAVAPGSRTAMRLANWLGHTADRLGLDLAAFAPDHRHRDTTDLETAYAHAVDRQVRRRRGQTTAAPDDPLLDPATWAGLVAEIRRLANESPTADISPLEHTLRALAELVDLPALDASVFGLLYRAQNTAELATLLAEFEDEIYDDISDTLLLCARTLGTPRQAVKKILGPGGALARSGLLNESSFTAELVGRRHQRRLIPAYIADVIEKSPATMADVARAILGDSIDPELEWQDFEHVAEARDLVTRLFTDARRQDQRGIHVLLFGETGTGKTQFCRVIARAAGLDLIDITSTDESGNPLNGRERLAELRVANAIAGRHRKAAVLFDEMEDLLGHSQVQDRYESPSFIRTITSKAHFNEFLENTPVPILWTANDIAGLDPAFLRRMTYVFRLDAPPLRARRRIWARTAERAGVMLPETSLTQFAETTSLAPGFIVNAVRVSRITGEPADTGRVLQQAARAMGRPAGAPSQAPAGDYEPSLVNSDQPIEALTTELLRSAGKAFGLCLYGPPGTGKSAFARWLADQLGMDVMFRRASDLFSTWVGETERNIARMFREAADSGEFLILDEADSLLRDRGLAHRSWEVSQVNEMLTWMEQHPLPFALTTNLMDNLDRATMRRVAFKVRFDYLKPAQAAHAFRHFLGCDAPPAIDRLDRLTPGDFRVVHRKREVLGVDDPRELLDLLRQEMALKQDGASRPMGFIS
jgi:SpoVK/Ycf46/Vps4 family AAA+-type ATPase